MATTNPHTSRILKLTLIALAGASLAACASQPKPMPLAEPQKSPPPPPERPYTPPPPPEAVQSQVLPGSSQDFVVNAGDRIYFDFDQYTIRADARAILEAQGTWLNRYPAVRVRIEGNADEQGTREYNFALAARRANAVKTFLVERGVNASRINTVSYGKERPIDTGTGDDAMAHNRNAHTAITEGAR
jgi:peptidoglycan-associated lipoprotein